MKCDDKGNGARSPAYFARLTFKNKAKNPSGAESTAKAMTAIFDIYDNGVSLIDSWEGRWANNDEPHDYPSKWRMDRLDLEENNQPAVLDIGLRFEGNVNFHGWNNQSNPVNFGGFVRKLIKPNRYKLPITLSASNYEEK